MDNSKFRVLSWLIVVTILVTVAVQGYWNWRNFEESRKYLISEVQTALDNAIEQYYTELAKVHFVKFEQGESHWNQRIIRPHADTGATDSMIRTTYKLRTKAADQNLIKIDIDSIVGSYQTNMVVVSSINDTSAIGPGEERFVKLASKLAMSLEADSLDFAKLDSLIRQELIRKDLSVAFDLWLPGSNKEVRESNLVFANSAYFPPGTEVAIAIDPGVINILKRGLSGVFVSVFTAMVIIFVLLYLYRFIQHQKSLDMMKNDLINNITHEFKTPIATVSTALEAIEKFNTEQDYAKTTKYLNLSNAQLAKLNLMVEKLLETATLEENELVLHREKIDLGAMISDVVDRYENTNGKTLKWDNNQEVLANVDPFHFEHVVSNLIDNAIKYGGDEIEITLNEAEHHIHLSVKDNGGNIPKSELNRIFDKFYRISQGNVHDVKGNGIGLYYAKAIVEKHKGTLAVSCRNSETAFDITLKI